MHSRDGASAGEPESEASVVNSAEVPTTNYEKNDSETICARNQITKFASEWKIKIKDRRTDRGFKEQWLTTVDNIQVTSKINELMNYCEEENDSSY